MMKRTWLLTSTLVVFSQPTWAIYGPDLARADKSLALQACQEANFANGRQVVDALRSDNPNETLRVLGEALNELKATSNTSAFYAARAFCIHEVVPSRLQPGGSHDSPSRTEPTPTVQQFKSLGIDYFYYDPDDEFTLANDPVDLEKLAMEHQDSPWGRQAFLMMTGLGWSHGACAEGPDQFREVIQRSEAFLSRYPNSEVSNDVRLETAKAYGTWWHLSRLTPQTGGPDDPASYLDGSREAKRKAIELYQEYLSSRKTDDKDVERRLKSLQENSMDRRARDYDYWCSDYED
jgi:hypothetical protein